jgi:hypothetical protein
LLFAIEHGAKAPRDRNGNAVEVVAANILALLFGREEGEDDTVAVPSSVIITVIESLTNTLQGKVVGTVFAVICDLRSVIALVTYRLLLD